MAIFYRAVHWDTNGSSADGDWWCDVFGPYEVFFDPVTEPGTERGTHQGVGPFLMRLQKGAAGYLTLGCSRCHRKKDPCKVYAVLNLDGSFVRRRHLHNHLPEPQLPTPLAGHLQLPAPPSFEQAASIVLPAISRGPRQDVLEDFDTKISTWDPDTQQMVETQITLENSGDIAKGARVEIIDGKKVFYCPVTTCSYTFGNTQAVHIHMSVHVRGKRMASVQANERLCPLCRMDMSSHETLVRHIVDDHDTRLECTEHEFETMDDFKNWKARTEQEDMATFTNVGHRRSGVYNCCRTGRKLTQDEYSMHTAYRKRLGVECPAAMMVAEADGRISVTYWRTHIGHTPNILDVRVSEEQRRFIMDLLARGYKRRAIVAEAAKRYYGQPLSRGFILDLKTLNQLCNVHRKFSDKHCTIDVPYMSDKGYNSDYLRVRLVRRVRECLELMAQPDDEGRRATESERIKHKIDVSSVLQVEFSHVVRHEVTGHIHVYRRTLQSDGAESNVVFPRKSSHETCEKRCEECQVCVHRYGCTCKKFMLEDHMCAHVHLVACKEGSPGPTWVDPTLQEDTVGLQEALRRLHRVNHRERLKTLRPRINEMLALLQGELNVDLDQLEEFLQSGLALLRTSRPRQITRDDEAGETRPLPPKEIYRLVKDCHPDYTALQFTDMPQKWKSNAIDVDKMLTLADERATTAASNTEEGTMKNGALDSLMDEVHIKIEPMSQGEVVAIETSAKYGGLTHHRHAASADPAKNCGRRAKRRATCDSKQNNAVAFPEISQAPKYEQAKRTSDQLKRLKKAKQILAAKGPKGCHTVACSVSSRLSAKARRRWGLRRAPWIERSDPVNQPAETPARTSTGVPRSTGTSSTIAVSSCIEPIVPNRSDPIDTVARSEALAARTAISSARDRTMSQQVKMPVMAKGGPSPPGLLHSQRLTASQHVKVPFVIPMHTTQQRVSGEKVKLPFTIRAQRAAQIRDESLKKAKITTPMPTMEIHVIDERKGLPEAARSAPTIVRVESLGATPKQTQRRGPSDLLEEIRITIGEPMPTKRGLLIDSEPIDLLPSVSRSFVIDEDTKIELS
ncbi:hypothetical protein BIW11_12495 [Tropilaelaps mercedesae]|uniref:C2H2-type domain-containing protein n=1 Tax=Tropilaelaps mercedesae TaxID=418985 RepID=A0A1V9X6F1_9ACAR|nr:hypothetical protein BIW11_12495 [Tropilaelaps mercedesae]